jgi:NADH-quinone oxidoreductase subunit J
MLGIGYIFLALTVAAGAISAVLARSLIHSAVALGVGSAALAALLFMLHAPYAASFELSVGAGLISVLFIVAISLVESMRGPRDEP